MYSDRQTLPGRIFSFASCAAALALLGAGAACNAQGDSREGLKQPIYRIPNQPVASSQPVARPVTQAIDHQPIDSPRIAQRPRRGLLRAATGADPSDPFAGVTPDQAGLSLIDTSVVPASATAPVAPFDLTQQPGEHPFMPCLRVMRGSLGTLDQRIADYSATFTKVERLNGTLGDPQQMQVRVRHRPFSIYMKFVQPNPGQEVLYVENQNDGKLVALASGWKRRIGKLNLDPNGAMAMRDQRYPITKAGDPQSGSRTGRHGRVGREVRRVRRHPQPQREDRRPSGHDGRSPPPGAAEEFPLPQGADLPRPRAAGPGRL